MEVKLETVAEQERSAGDAENGNAKPIRVAILSLLFNWPSTGGGNHHTAEMARFLADRRLRSQASLRRISGLGDRPRHGATDKPQRAHRVR